jgi:small subunit ribosomal protein S20
MRQNPKRRLRNRFHSSRARTFIKQAREALDGSDADQARTATLTAIRALDKAAEKGVIHKNNAARRKSRLMKHLNALAS